MFLRRLLILGSTALALIFSIAPIIGSKTAHAATAAPLEKGAWAWMSVSSMSQSAMQQIVNEANVNGMNAIYLSIGDYLPIDVMPNGAAKQAALQVYENKLNYLLSLAWQYRISVDAEAGDSSWAAQAGTTTSQPAYDVLNFVAAYNQAHAVKFRGVQYDIEPYTLATYATNPAPLLTNYAALAEGLVNGDKNYGMPLTFVVPFFYNSASAATPEITLDGTTNYTYETLLRVLNKAANGRLIVMAYRNFALGAGGTVALAQAEIKEADATNVKVIVAQEAGNVTPAYVTFYGTSKAALATQTALVGQSFTADAAFGGIGINDITTYQALP